MSKIHENSEHSDALARLITAHGETHRGEVLGWASIEKAIGKGRNDPGGWYVLRKFRRWLRIEKRVVTLPMFEVGLRFLTNKEAVREVPILRQRRAFKQLGRGLNELAAVDVGDLSAHEQIAFAKQRENIRGERRRLRASGMELKAILSPQKERPVPPRREAPASVDPRRILGSARRAKATV